MTLHRDFIGVDFRWFEPEQLVTGASEQDWLFSVMGLSRSPYLSEAQRRAAEECVKREVEAMRLYPVQPFGMAGIRRWQAATLRMRGGVPQAVAVALAVNDGGGA